MSQDVSRPISSFVVNAPDIGTQFVAAARCGDVRRLQELLDRDVPVNYQDVRTGTTALHSAAGSRARPALRLLLSTGQCDFLIRDGQGRLASEMAYVYGKDSAMARLLARKEVKQAREQGIALTRRPRP